MKIFDFKRAIGWGGNIFNLCPLRERRNFLANYVSLEISEMGVTVFENIFKSKPEENMLKAWRE